MQFRPIVPFSPRGLAGREARALTGGPAQSAAPSAAPLHWTVDPRGSTHPRPSLHRGNLNRTPCAKLAGPAVGFSTGRSGFYYQDASAIESRELRLGIGLRFWPGLYMQEYHAPPARTSSQAAVEQLLIAITLRGASANRPAVLWTRGRLRRGAMERLRAWQGGDHRSYSNATDSPREFQAPYAKIWWAPSLL